MSHTWTHRVELSRYTGSLDGEFPTFDIIDCMTYGCLHLRGDPLSFCKLSFLVSRWCHVVGAEEVLPCLPCFRENCIAAVRSIRCSAMQTTRRLTALRHASQATPRHATPRHATPHATPRHTPRMISCRGTATWLRYQRAPLSPHPHPLPLRRHGRLGVRKGRGPTATGTGILTFLQRKTRTHA